MKAFEIIVIIIMLATSILIGSPISYNCLPINIVVSFIGIIFLIYLGFIKKEKILNNKLDIAILILSISPVIPIIFNTYVSLEDSIISLLKYISCFIIYLLIKYGVKENEKSKNVIINVIIFSSVILSIIGIDNMTTRIFSDSLENIGLPYVINVENRMFSSLGYANSFAIILGTSIILIINQIVHRKGKKYELIYSGILFLNLACLLLTSSRTVLILLLIAIITYLLIDKNKKKTIYTIYPLIYTGILSLIYGIMWNSGQIVWITTAICFAIAVLMQYLLDILYKKIERISKKSYIIIISSLIIMAVIAVIVGIKLTVPLTLFLPDTSSNDVKYKIQNIEPNTEYSLKFDIIAKSTTQNINNYKIIIVEENKYYDKVAEHEIEFNNFEGIKEIKFTSTEETVELALYFKSEYKIAQLGLTINSLKINEKEHTLKYLYLPVNLVDKLKDINVKDKSVWERGTYYLDSLKIIKDNIFTGIGGNGWKYTYINASSYNYSSTEVHSYLLQVFLENGLIAFMALLAVIIILIVWFIKDRKNNLAIIIAVFLLLIHSFVDFDMSFLYIMMLAFILLGIISSSHEEIKMNKIINITISVILILIFTLTGVIGICKILKTEPNLHFKIMELVNNQQYNEAINLFKENQKTERYITNFSEIINIDFEKVNDENLNYLYEILSKIPVTTNVEYNMQKNELIKQIINKTQNREIKEKFMKVIVEQNEANIEMIKNKEKNRLTDKEIDNYLNKQQKIYENVNILI